MLLLADWLQKGSLEIVSPSVLSGGWVGGVDWGVEKGWIGGVQRSTPQAWFVRFCPD